jgi:hypothetical protein
MKLWRDAIVKLWYKQSHIEIKDRVGKRRQDIQHNDIQYNDAQHNDTRHNNKKRDTENNGPQCCYIEC